VRIEAKSETRAERQRDREYAERERERERLIFKKDKRVAARAVFALAAAAVIVAGERGALLGEDLGDDPCHGLVAEGALAEP